MFFRLCWFYSVNLDLSLIATLVLRHIQGKRWVHLYNSRKSLKDRQTRIYPKWNREIPGNQLVIIYFSSSCSKVFDSSKVVNNFEKPWRSFVMCSNSLSRCVLLRTVFICQFAVQDILSSLRRVHISFCFVKGVYL